MNSINIEDLSLLEGHECSNCKKFVPIKDGVYELTLKDGCIQEKRYFCSEECKDNYINELKKQMLNRYKREYNELKNKIDMLEKSIKE